MKLKEECRSGAKNKGEPCEPTLIPLRALTAALGSVPTVALSSASGISNIPSTNQRRRNPNDSCDGVDSPPDGERIPAIPCQLDPTPGPWPSGQAY